MECADVVLSCFPGLSERPHSCITEPAAGNMLQPQSLAPPACHQLPVVLPRQPRTQAAPLLRRGPGRLRLARARQVARRKKRRRSGRPATTTRRACSPRSWPRSRSCACCAQARRRPPTRAARRPPTPLQRPLASRGRSRHPSPALPAARPPPPPPRPASGQRARRRSTSSGIRRPEAAPRGAVQQAALPRAACACRNRLHASAPPQARPRRSPTLARILAAVRRAPHGAR